LFIPHVGCPSSIEQCLIRQSQHLEGQLLYLQ
jgi:hypothetical protein